jgi:hypothetical protein
MFVSRMTVSPVRESTRLLKAEVCNTQGKNTPVMASLKTRTWHSRTLPDKFFFLRQISC